MALEPPAPAADEAACRRRCEARGSACVAYDFAPPACALLARLRLADAVPDAGAQHRVGWRRVCPAGAGEGLYERAGGSAPLGTPPHLLLGLPVRFHRPFW